MVFFPLQAFNSFIGEFCVWSPSAENCFTAPHHFVSIHILLSWLSPPTTFLCGLVCGHAHWHGIFGTNYTKMEMNKRMFAALVASDLFFFIEINPVSIPKTHYESHKTRNLSIVPTEKWSACLMKSIDKWPIWRIIAVICIYLAELS